MKVERIFANNDIILFELENDRFLPYLTCQTCEMKSLKNYEEITNNAVKKVLLKNHNDAIGNMLEMYVLTDNNCNINDDIVNALEDAILEI